jgi:hypothetical protein
MALILRRPKAVSKDEGQFAGADVMGAPSFETPHYARLLRTRE